MCSSINIANSFGRSAKHYHKKAIIQRKVAEGLVASLNPWKDTLPKGPILEIGCGTGLLSQKMIYEFPNREFVLSDVSNDMLAFTKDQLGEANNIKYQILDADQITSTEPKFACIVSNFAVQWFSQPAIGLEKLGELLLPDGLLLVAFPSNNSFSEWYEKCLELGLPYTANPFPVVEEVVVKLSLGPFQIDYYENNLHQNFNRSFDFFKHIKEIGAGFSTTGKSLSTKQMKLLTNYWDQQINPISITWHIVYLAAKKDAL